MLRRRTPPLVIEEPTTTTSKPERATIRFSPTKGSTTVLPESTTYAKEVTNIWIAVKNTAKNASVTQEETSSKRQKRSSTGESGDFQTTTKLPESTTQAKATQNILIVVKNSTTNAQTQQTTSSKPEGPTTIPSKKGSGDFQTTTKLPEPTTQAKEATQKLVIVVQNSTTAATPTKETTPSKPERPTKIQSTKGSGNIQTTTKLPESTTQAKDILIIIKNSTTNAPTQQTRSSKPEGSTKIPSTKGSSNIQTTTKLPESTTQAKEILIIIKNSTTNAPTQQTTSLKPEKSTTEESGDIRTTTVLPGAIIKVEAAVKEILKVYDKSSDNHWLELKAYCTSF
ncbi:unnamed protein product [Caenorhabditis auriculariae]|uniref:Uncharacterized protein n=1 Tax=Caenorhabditis auriculariae TaxID=2777116 RepID=A0A8S1H790_9PELO|nr:unnamed protein product [Caenorhabditis auriculariae]